MKQLTVEQHVDAPAAVVWDVVTDLSRTAEIISGIKSLERIDDGEGFGVGTRWRETRVMFKREATEEMEVVSIEEGRSYDVQAGNASVTYRSSIGVAPVGDAACTLSMSFGAEVHKTFAKVMSALLGWVGAKATRKAIESDLADIAAAAEAQASQGTLDADDAAGAIEEGGTVGGTASDAAEGDGATSEASDDAPAAD